MLAQDGSLLATFYDENRVNVPLEDVAPIMKMAEWLTANGRRIHRPMRILSAAEALHDGQRKFISEAFGCPVHNTYGCREFMLIAAECEEHKGLHVNADHLCVELGASVGGANASADTPREIIVTDLHNYGMPLLRYVNGDLATAGSGTCACGRGLPLLTRVDGRKLDALRTPDGRYVPGEYIVYAFLHATGIKRYQVVQKRLDAFDISLVRDADFDPSVVDRYVRVSDRDSFLTARRITKEEGLLAGGSCGTAVWAALEVGRELRPNARLERVAIIVSPTTSAASSIACLSAGASPPWLRPESAGFRATA